MRKLIIIFFLTFNDVFTKRPTEVMFWFFWIIIAECYTLIFLLKHFYYIFIQKFFWYYADTIFKILTLRTILNKNVYIYFITKLRIVYSELIDY